MTLALFDGNNEYRKVEGVSLAPCNDATTKLTLAQIEAARAERIKPDTFRAALFLLAARYDREFPNPLLEYYYDRMAPEMGESEFRAAFHDAMATKLFHAEILSFFLSHVEKQRENGPDLFMLALSESNHAAN